MSSNIRLTIDLDAIEENWRMLSDIVFPSEVAAVVKSDAYGLGISRVAPVLYRAGCRSFFAGHMEEGLDVCDVVPECAIYVINGFPHGEEAQGIQSKLIPVINSLDELTRLKTTLGTRFPIALHFDTGIHRQGLDESDIAVLRERRNLLHELDVRLVLTHLVTSETPQHPLNRRQRERFVKALEVLPGGRYTTSIASSAGIFLGSQYYFDQVRPGAALYGINPVPGQPNNMRNVATLEARILQINDVPAGETIGYGGDYLVMRESRIATLSIGYGDGVPRTLGNKGWLWGKGMRLPIVGRVSMDLMTVDITDCNRNTFSPGDFIELFGQNRSIDDVAADAGTIPHEILTGLGRRCSRVYVSHD